MASRWAQHRKAARRAVHANFSLEAVYTVALTGAQYPVEARLHRKSATVGEGSDYAALFAEDDRVVLDLNELTGDPQKGDAIYFTDDDVTVLIDVVEPPDPPFVACKVTLYE